MYLPLLCNEINVWKMKNNLLPPFIISEAIIKVNETPKIHVDNPSVEDHVIYIQEAGMKIKIQLWIIVSFFHNWTPTYDEIERFDKIFITTDSATW